MKVIDIENVTKIYNDSEVKVHAVNGISLSFEEGEFAAIVGPSGSGKTTLLNLIGGIDKPTKGDIIIGGNDISKYGDGIAGHNPFQGRNGLVFVKGGDHHIR